MISQLLSVESLPKYRFLKTQAVETLMLKSTYSPGRVKVSTVIDFMNLFINARILAAF